MASKIIVIGSPNCQLQAVFTKLAKLHAKQNFAFAIIVGNLFGDCSTEAELNEISALLQGNIHVPLTTYFTVGSRPLPTRIVEKIEADDEVCPNLYFLGKRGILKTAEGIRIAALGGQLDQSGSFKSKPETNTSGKFQSTYSESDARALYGMHNADILITNQWPKDVRFGSKVAVPEDYSSISSEVQIISDVCATLRPRYHFSASDSFFYEREPFFHMPTEDNPDTKPITRFISLASFDSKQKALYAFSLDPSATAPLTIPAGVTASPLSAPQAKRKNLPSQKESFHRFAAHDGPHDSSYNQHRGKRQQREPPPGPDRCFFCLSNPNIATHLITSIGDQSYLTTAKGPLPPVNFSPSLGFPGHMLIIPFEHTPTLGSIPDPTTRSSTYIEMVRFNTALRHMVSDRSSGQLGAVTWEVSRAGGIHTHWQFLPVPMDLIKEGLVELAFKVEAENLKYPRFSGLAIAQPDGAADSEPESGNAPGERGDYFRVSIWSSGSEDEQESNGDAGADADADSSKTRSPGSENVLTLELNPDFKFDLQFGRRVMAKLLQLDKRMNWKDATQSQAEEEADANAFKEAFKPYDFSL
ncbi:CwfJ domain protein [Penicillium brasilianum]|uniref:CwfJ domain protein n=1 Tax=Penicillium brasilianum TaxID=104259 RepID=A0A1S9RGC2_PENBI|nr:CwfJ domain protein [Penicillium brasilianum]